MCTREDMLAPNLGVPYFDDVMSYNLLTAIVYTNVSLGKRSQISEKI